MTIVFALIMFDALKLLPSLLDAGNSFKVAF